MEGTTILPLSLYGNVIAIKSKFGSAFTLMLEQLVPAVTS
jgi:hypothetical protein